MANIHISREKLEKGIKRVAYKINGYPKIIDFFISEIFIKNYKKYENETFEFKSKFTLLVGENATGKTTILDAIATSIGGFLSGFSGINSKETHNINKKDIFTKYKKSKNGIENIVVNYSEITGTYIINEGLYEWKRYRNGINSRTLMKKNENEMVFDLVRSLEDAIELSPVVFPVFSYHGTGRLWEQDWKPSSKMENLQRIDAYKDCLNAKSNYRNFLSWFEKLSRMAFEDGERNPLLESVKEVIKETLNYLTDEKIKNIAYRDKDLLVTYNNEEIHKVGLLSDGYRNIIGFVSDIAYRIAILNPNLEDNIKKTPGIVLIDEIDLHLHPKWQKKIVGLLIDLFPKVQFIATSHSPFIIQSMEAGGIIDLDKNENLTTNATKMSIEDIAEDIMKVEHPQMSQRKQEMLKVAEEYFDILDKVEEGKVSQKDVEELKDKLDELSEPFEDNVAYVAFLKRKRMIAEKRMEQKNETSK